MSYKFVGPGQHIQKFIDSKCERIYMRVELQASIDIASGRQIYLLFLFFSFQALNRFSRKIKTFTKDANFAIFYAQTGMINRH